MESKLEKQEVNYNVKCINCGKDARMTYVMRNEDGKCVGIECKHCKNEYEVSLESIKRFEAIGAVIREAKHV